MLMFVVLQLNYIRIILILNSTLQNAYFNRGTKVNISGFIKLNFMIQEINNGANGICGNVNKNSFCLLVG